MAYKEGNGGYGPEQYDESTGKYTADGQPNSSYNNTQEFATGKKWGEKRGHRDYSPYYNKELYSVATEDEDKFKEQCMKDLGEETGLSGEELNTAFKNLDNYLTGLYEDMPKKRKEDLINSVNHTLELMGKYNGGNIYRGIKCTDIKKFYRIGGLLQDSLYNNNKFNFETSKGYEMLTSWTTKPLIARDFSGIDRASRHAIQIVCKNNKSGVSVRHLSTFAEEDEVLHPSTSKFKCVAYKEVTETNRDGQPVKVIYAEVEEV